MLTQLAAAAVDNGDHYTTQDVILGLGMMAAICFLFWLVFRD